MADRCYLIATLNKSSAIATQLRHVLFAKKSAKVAQKHEDQALFGRTPDFAQSPFCASRKRQSDIGRGRADWRHTASRYVLGHHALQIMPSGTLAQLNQAYSLMGALVVLNITPQRLRGGSACSQWQHRVTVPLCPNPVSSTIPGWKASSKSAERAGHQRWRG